MLYSAITHEPTYNGYPLCSTQYGYRIDILDKILQFLHSSCQHHDNMMVLRFDVRFPDDQRYPEDNQLFERFMAAYVQDRKRHGNDIAYLWTREQEDSINHHYHVVLFLNQDPTKWFFNHFVAAERNWQRVINSNSPGLIDHCLKDPYGNERENAIFLKAYGRIDHPAIVRAFTRLSYIAKFYSKGKKPYRHREYGSSIMRHPSTTEPLTEGAYT